MAGANRGSGDDTGNSSTVSRFAMSLANGKILRPLRNHSDGDRPWDLFRSKSRGGCAVDFHRDEAVREPGKLAVERILGTG